MRPSHQQQAVRLLRDTGLDQFLNSVEASMRQPIFQPATQMTFHATPGTAVTQPRATFPDPFTEAPPPFGMLGSDFLTGGRGVGAVLAGRAIAAAAVRGRGRGRGRSNTVSNNRAGEGAAEEDHGEERAPATRGRRVASRGGISAGARGRGRGRGRGTRTTTRSTNNGHGRTVGGLDGWMSPDESEEEEEANVEFTYTGPREVLSSLNQMHLPKTNWSITLSSQGQDAPMSWLDAIQSWMTQVKPIRGVFSYEVGGRHRHGHVQGLLTVRWPGDEYHKNLLKTCFIDLLHVSPTDQRHFTFKVMKEGQTVYAMIGYVTKDKGRPTFRFVRYNVSDDDLERGMIEYQRVSLNYKAGRLEIDK